MFYYIKKLWLLILKLLKTTDIDNKIFNHFVDVKLKKILMKFTKNFKQTKKEKIQKINKIIEKYNFNEIITITNFDLINEKLIDKILTKIKNSYKL